MDVSEVDPGDPHNKVLQRGSSSSSLAAPHWRWNGSTGMEKCWVVFRNRFRGSDIPNTVGVWMLLLVWSSTPYAIVLIRAK